MSENPLIAGVSIVMSRLKPEDVARINLNILWGEQKDMRTDPSWDDIVVLFNEKYPNGYPKMHAETERLWHALIPAALEE